jgi:hypothetical protein
MSIDISHTGESIQSESLCVWPDGRMQQKLAIEVRGNRLLHIADEIAHDAALYAETQIDVLASAAISEGFLNRRWNRNRHETEAV